MTAVATWPSYLLRGVPQQTRLHMSDRALRDNVSLADVVRQALCHRYRMECDDASYRYQPALDTQGDVLLVRIQPEVWRQLKKEAGASRTTTATYGRTKALILNAIDDYLGEEP
jgi:hypothetical protein